MSWQAFLLDLFLRVAMKRHADKPFDLDRVRTTTLNPPKRALHIPQGFSVEEIEAPGGLKFDVAERTEPRTGEPRLAVLYLHGGGYFFGSPKTHRQIAIGLTRELSAPVYSLDYRLAPEHRFPAAVEDAEAAYEWLAHKHPSSPLLLAGDSAGGGLALVTAIAARDKGRRSPAGLIGFSPWTDLAGTGPSMETNSKSCAMFTGRSVKTGAGVYLGDASPQDPRASPLYADLAGLPPMLLFASNHEVLRDDTVRLAEKARAAGVPVELILRDKLPHVWPIFLRLIPEGREAMSDIGRFVAGLGLETRAAASAA
jgi:acetyl esterase/lipase